MAIPMGIGQLGFDNTVFKRNFRFTFTLDTICGNPNLFVPTSFVKMAGRPSFSVAETEFNFLNSKRYSPGKANWEPINLSYYDVASNVTQPLFNWIASVYNFSDPIRLNMGSGSLDYSARGIITMLDGCGEPLETWVLEEVFPTSVNFGELDYASSEISTIELTLRYNNVYYYPQCPVYSISPCCSSSCEV